MPWPNSMPKIPAPMKPPRRPPNKPPPNRPGRPKKPPPGAGWGVVLGRVGWDMVRSSGRAEFGAVEVGGGALKVREPRLPEPKPPPTRASATVAKTSAAAMATSATNGRIRRKLNIQSLPGAQKGPPLYQHSSHRCEGSSMVSAGRKSARAASPPRATHGREDILSTTNGLQATAGEIYAAGSAVGIAAARCRMAGSTPVPPHRGPTTQADASVGAPQASNLDRSGGMSSGVASGARRASSAWVTR